MVYSKTTPALSAREAAVLRWANEERRARITTDEIQTLLGQQVGVKVASSLARKGVLDRVGRGIYAVRPLGMEVSSSASPLVPALVGIAHLLVDQPYYVGGPAVLNLHRLTTPMRAPHVDVYIRGHRRSRVLGGTRVLFHSAGTRAFEFGLMSCALGGISITVSDPERTLLDLLERSNHLLEARVAQQVLQEQLSHIRMNRLLEYAVRWPTASTCQRLGLLLERAGVGADVLASLAARVAASRGVPAMLPESRRIGGVHPIWRVVMNDVRRVQQEHATVLPRRRR